ncbi:hypothetical protein L7F22_040641 [Adiantum nelumboides]|nr:hypothetical protein [Adiantum nelumboides]
MTIIAEKELFSLFELPPTISYPIFTPLHLFCLLNLLIVSIFLITHLRKEAPRQGAHSSATLCHTLPASLRLDHHGEFIYAENQAPYGAEVIELHADQGEDAEMWKKSEEFEPDVARSDEEWSKSDKVLVRSAHQKEREGLVKQSAAIVMEFASNRDDDGPYEGKEIKQVISEELNVISENATEMAYKNLASYDKQNSSEQWCSSANQERPLASRHFSHKRTTTRMHGCNSPLKISRPNVRRGDTLDATWKAICEQKSKHASPSYRHRVAGRSRRGDCHMAPNVVEDDCHSKEARVACFSPSKQRQRVPSSSTSSLAKRRDPSMSRDELNARVESFISKFNQQIKLQRQESLLNQIRLVKRGAK